MPRTRRRRTYQLLDRHPGGVLPGVDGTCLAHACGESFAETSVLPSVILNRERVLLLLQVKGSCRLLDLLSSSACGIRQGDWERRGCISTEMWPNSFMPTARDPRPRQVR